MLEAASVLQVCAEMNGQGAFSHKPGSSRAPLRCKGATCLVFSHLLSCKLLL